MDASEIDVERISCVVRSLGPKQHTHTHSIKSPLSLLFRQLWLLRTAQHIRARTDTQTDGRRSAIAVDVLAQVSEFLQIFAHVPIQVDCHPQKEGAAQPRSRSA